MQLLYPIGLLSAVAISVPLLIHLWKVKKGKTIKIGSIIFLGASARKSAKSFRFSDWLLLFLRCLILILLAFIIAKPYQQDGKEKPQGWILSQKGNFPFVYQQHRLVIDSLLKKGFTLHDFAPGFSALTLNDTVQTDTVATSDADYFSLLKQLNVLIPAKQEVYLFHDQRIQEMGLAVPKLTYQLREYNIRRTDSLSQWVSTWRGKAFDGQSTAWSTSYQWKQAPATEINIFMNASGTTGDQAYLKAALQAIADYSGRRIKVTTWNKELFLRLKPDMVFWLSDLPLDPLLKTSWRKEAQVFTYAQGKVQQRESAIHLDAAKDEAQHPVLLKKRIASTYRGKNLWTDGYGDAILSLQEKQDWKHYQLYTRFNPEWTSLVWDEQFVKALMPLVIGAIDQDLGFGFELHPDDRRSVVLPDFEVERNSGFVLQPVLPQQSLRVYFWLSALFLFILERIVSWFKNAKTEIDA